MREDNNNPNPGVNYIFFPPIVRNLNNNRLNLLSYYNPSNKNKANKNNLNRNPEDLNSGFNIEEVNNTAATTRATQLENNSDNNNRNDITIPPLYRRKIPAINPIRRFYKNIYKDFLKV